jgi:pseudouridine synthase
MQKPTTLAPGYERLEKVMAHKGLSSRREAKALITKGAVSVNGRMVTEPGFGVMPETDIIEIDGINALAPKESFLVYKPRGIETSKTNPSSKDLHDQFPALKHLHPIGRLDKESEGLIIMSDDGVLARALTKIDSTVGKTYLATVREQVPDASLNRMSNGIRIDGIMTKPSTVTRASRTSFTITLHEGRKHQIRRMGDACKLTLESLERVAIGHLTAGSMKPGEMKRIPTKDIEILKGTE